MNLLLIATIFAPLGLSSVVQLERRVVDGEIVSPKFKYRWMVDIEYYESQTCGGTLPTGNKAITAAYCIHQDELNQYTIHLARHDLCNRSGDEVVAPYKITKVWLHDGYEKTHDGKISQVIRFLSVLIG